MRKFKTIVLAVVVTLSMTLNTQMLFAEPGTDTPSKGSSEQSQDVGDNSTSSQKAGNSGVEKKSENDGASLSNNNRSNNSYIRSGNDYNTGNFSYGNNHGVRNNLVANKPSKVNHGLDMSRYSINRVTGYFYDRKHQLKERDKDSIVIDFTGGFGDSTVGIDNMARIRSYFDDETNRFPRSFMLDTGSSSQVEPYSVIHDTEAPLLRIMGTAKYDLASIGPADIISGVEGIEAMINKQIGSQYVVPYMNNPGLSGNDKLSSLFSDYGAGDYTVLNKYGSRVAVFNVMGAATLDRAKKAGFKVSDPIKTAEKTIKKIKKEADPDIIICIADFGGDKGLEKVKEFTANTDGMDLVLCAGMSKDSNQAISENGAKILGVSEGTGNVARVVFSKDGDKGYRYSSFSVERKISSMPETKSVREALDAFKTVADKSYFSKYGTAYSKKLTQLDFDIPKVGDVSETKEDLPIVDLVSDSYRKAAKRLAGVRLKNTIGVVSTRAFDGGLKKGVLRSSDVFSLLGKGSGSNGSRGIDMVTFHIRGKDLIKMAESSTDLVKDDRNERIIFSGMEYIYNPHRLVGNKVYDLKLLNNGKKYNVEPDRLYTVVTDSVTAGHIKKLSMDENSAAIYIMRDSKGRSIKKFPVLKKKSGVELKAWAALSNELESMGKKGVPDRYRKADGRAGYDSSILPSHILKGANKMMGIVIAIGVIAIAGIILLIILLIKIFGGPGGPGGRNTRRNVAFPKKSKKKPIFTKK